MVTNTEALPKTEESPVKKIPLVNVPRQIAALKKEYLQAIKQVLQRADFILGEDVKKFEEEFAGYMGTDYAIGVDNGTSAIELSLRAFGVGPGDEVIVPVYTFIATATAVAFTGAKPVFVDIREDTFNLDINKVQAAITPKTRAIIPVHLYGRAVDDIEDIVKLASQHGIAVIEDTCQAHGVIINGKRAGTVGDAGAFSFFPSKNLGGMGDGGMVVTRRPELVEKIRKLRNCGRVNHYVHDMLGYNKRLDTLQAAVLRVKLRCLDDWNNKRVANANLYHKLLSRLPVTLPNQNSPHVYHLYVIRTEHRDELRKFLAESGIDTGIHYPVPLHLQGAFKYLGCDKDDFPIAERVADSVLSLPMCPFLKKSEIRRIATAVKQFFKFSLTPKVAIS